MKNKTIGILIIIAILTLLVGVLACYKGKADQIKFKKDAELFLKRISELLVKQTYDSSLQYRNRNKGNKKSLIRTFQNKDFAITVPIDSAKDCRSLYDLGTSVGAEAMILMSKNQFPLDSIYAKWQSFLDERNVVCALQLNVDPVLQQDTLVIAGDSLLCIPKNKFKTYYMDSFYAIQLTTYLYFPAYLADAPLSLKILFYILLGVDSGYLFWFLFTYQRKEKYVIGDYVLHYSDQQLFYKGEFVTDSKQLINLLRAFMRASDSFLSNDTISQICGWSLTDIGIEDRRKMAMVRLRKELSRDESINIVFIKRRKGYQLVINSVNP